MKIKFKAMGIPKTTGVFLKPVDDTDSATGYQSEAQGSKLNEVYYQQTTASVQGERLGVYFTAWIPYSIFEKLSITPKRENKIIVGGHEHSIIDIIEHTFSIFEDHYEFNLLLPNT